MYYYMKIIQFIHLFIYFTLKQNVPNHIKVKEEKNKNQIWLYYNPKPCLNQFS